MEKVIEIRNLSYTYPDSKEALDDVNMDVFENECIGLIGPNGSGKTTLLLHLNGVLKGLKGSVKIMGMEISDANIKKIRSIVGLVFQDPNDQLFSPTVFDEIAFGPINMGLSEDDVKKRVSEALECVGMRGYEDRMPYHLSFGEKKKISLASVLSMNPKIIGLDEPTANLDPKSRRDLIKIIKRLKIEGKTIIIATHDLNAISAIVDRVFILNKTIIAKGTPREIFLNTELLESENLDVPDVAILFKILSCFGYDSENLPLSISDAVSHLTKTIEANNRQKY